MRFTILLSLVLSSVYAGSSLGKGASTVAKTSQKPLGGGKGALKTVKSGMGSAAAGVKNVAKNKNVQAGVIGATAGAIGGGIVAANMGNSNEDPVNIIQPMDSVETTF